MHSVLNVCARNIRIEGRLLHVGRLEAEKYKLVDDPEAMIGNLRRCGVRIDLFTFTQGLLELSPKYRYPMEWDNLAVLPVSTFDHWWTKQIDNKTRNMVRKAEKKGVEVREVAFGQALVQGIWEVYNETPVRQGTRNTHYGEDIETVYKEEATYLDSSLFIGAFFNGQLIGFAKLTHDDNRTLAYLINIVSMVRHRDRAPTNALIARAVRTCATRGIPHLVYAKFSYGKRRRDSLSDFKEHNGFKQVDLPRYYVPLTGFGWAALHLGLHHRLRDRLPEPVIASLRELRKTWYNRKLQDVMEAS